MLHISSLFNNGYVEALNIVKKEQPMMWKKFCNEIPTFSVAFFDKILYLPAFLTHIYYRKIIRISKIKYRTIWAEKGGDIIAYLDRVFGIKGEFVINAYVCITPLYIRNIKKCFFLLPTNADSIRVEELFLHEISHFYFYSLCVFGENNSHIIWELSEYIVPFLIQDYFGRDYRKDGYLGKPSGLYESEIKKWVQGAQKFEDLIKNTVEKEGDLSK